MNARNAKKLHARDEVIFRLAPGYWENGYLLTDPIEGHDGIFVDVVGEKSGYQMGIRHTDLK